MTELAELLEQGDSEQECPGCGKTIRFRVGGSSLGPTLDVSHPQPPCDAFRAFVERLFDAQRKAAN